MYFYIFDFARVAMQNIKISNKKSRKNAMVGRRVTNNAREKRANRITLPKTKGA